ncbi:hypothetical protein PGO_001960 [Plasmodium gonderi]|uniref:Variable surface protein n=1 Tax=Plasmodium gonderi TaxID=77519 RepID=A0A1Y1JWQ2_PLAGO|nr:hypothetical protein PGO_001960 [Plasmodium gonderi]GAW84254.1 hypothetical protein PGO_001960 [Plasmodium gonderi]
MYIIHNVILFKDCYEYKLPSNLYKQQLLKHLYLESMKNDFELPNPYETIFFEHVDSLKANLYINYRAIVNEYCEKNQDFKCCRDINYFFNLIIAIIKTSKLNKIHQNDMVNDVNEYWKNKFEKYTDFKCKREKGVYSKEKRCILKQVYDIREDKDIGVSDTMKSNNNLKKKLGKIINYDCSYYDNLSVIINRSTNNVTGKYKKNLLIFNDNYCADYNKINPSAMILYIIP